MQTNTYISLNGLFYQVLYLQNIQYELSISSSFYKFTQNKLNKIKNIFSMFFFYFYSDICRINMQYNN